MPLFGLGALSFPPKTPRHLYMAIIGRTISSGELQCSRKFHSLSSYSGVLRQVQSGTNKEGDSLPQFNLALVFGETSNLPFYYRKLAGNIPDTKTVKHLLADLATLKFTKAKLVMDRGFYSEDNLNALFKEHVKFLIASKMSVSWVRRELEILYENFRNFDVYNDTCQLYCRTIQTKWHYTQKRPYKGDPISESRRVYLHYYCNIDKAAEKEKAFDRQLMELRHEMESEKRIPEHEN